MWSPGSSSRSSEDRTLPGAINMELSTWSTCFLFSFFLLLIVSPITFSSKEFAKFPWFPNSWDLRTRQPNVSSQHFMLGGPVCEHPPGPRQQRSAQPEVQEARASPPVLPLLGSPSSMACRGRQAHPHSGSLGRGQRPEIVTRAWVSEPPRPAFTSRLS